MAQKKSYLLRIEKATGRTLWRVERPTNARRESPDAYTTPAILRYGKNVEMVITGGDVVTGHDLASGKELWRADGLNPTNDASYRIVASPVVHGDIIIAPTRERPMLVLYSADWCDPCRWLRPTFARLVRFYDKAEVRYCNEDEWRRSRGVDFIPQFVAYFPNGARVNCDAGSTTKELWETMNKLITLGESWSGEGELVCDQYSSAIVPKRTR